MKRVLTALASALGLTLALVSASQAQTQVQPPSSKETLAELRRDTPSEKEFSELLAKADEKVSAFEAAVKVAKPSLDRIDPNYAANYADAAAAAHLLISKMRKNGTSAYGLVGLLATLDDLSRDAANGSTFLLADDDYRLAKGASRDVNARDGLLALSAAGTSCNDIAELIFHATLRLIHAQETALSMLLGSQS